MVKAKIFTVAKIFDGEINESDLTLVEEELPPLEHNEYLVEAWYLSVDPYMRAYAINYKIGQVMIGIQVAKVIESKNAEHPIGQVVVGNLGWRTHTIISPDHGHRIYPLPDLGDLPISLGLGILGAPGIAAYFGFLEYCKPVEGETVVVTGAAGAVGSHVGQIAKIKGCKVVGLTGSDEKAVWLKSLGFDYVINYKTTRNLAEELRNACPEGIDCYFDNVGGETSSIIMNQMNEFGRVSVCGSISSYNAQQPIKATIIQPIIVTKQLELHGFVSRRFVDSWMEGIYQNLEWVKEGKLKYRETITHGFENTTKALIGVIKGENIGKAVVKVKASHVEDESLNFRDALSKFQQLKRY